MIADPGGPAGRALSGEPPRNIGGEDRPEAWDADSGFRSILRSKESLSVLWADVRRGAGSEVL